MTIPFNVFTATCCAISSSLSVNNPRNTIPNSPIEYYIHTYSNNYIPCPIVSNISSCFIEMTCFADHTSAMCSLFILRSGTSDDYDKVI